MTLCTIALGGNLGSVATTFRTALTRLESKETTVRAVSSFHETAPVGAQAGTTFLNAAATVETSLLPLDFLDRLQAIETSLGRTRELRWGPRTLDLDLLFWADEVFDLPRLVVPHPAAWYRRFVLDPLVEICPEFVHPVKHVTIHELRDRLLPRPLTVVLATAPGRAIEMSEALAAEFPDVELSEWRDGRAQIAAPDDQREPALIVWLGESGAASVTYSALPELPRLDASESGAPLETLRAILHAALGK